MQRYRRGRGEGDWVSSHILENVSTFSRSVTSFGSDCIKTMMKNNREGSVGKRLVYKVSEVPFRLMLSHADSVAPRC
jgi:hypothetical protein